MQLLLFWFTWLSMVALSLHAGQAADPEVVIIWDGKATEGQYTKGSNPYIVLTSPNEENYHSFRKGG
jgi:hypothetical protein